MTGIDFTYINVDISSVYQDSEPAILFKFNYTENRELFEIGDHGNYLNETDEQLDPMLCEIGEYTHNNANIEWVNGSVVGATNETCN